MKKLMNILLCVILVLSVGAVAMAEEKEYTNVTILYDSTCTETSTSGIGSQIIVDYIQDNSNGAVTVDAHSNYSLFPQDQIIPAVMSGQLGMTFAAGLGIGVIPYLPGDAAKILFALIIGPRLRKEVQRIR